MNTYMSFAEQLDGKSHYERVAEVLDESGSMDDPDWPPTRLHGAMKAAEALIIAKAAASPRDEVGVVSFSETARIIHAPLAVGEGASRLVRSLRNLEPQSSTDIAAGLILGGEMLLGGEIAKLSDSRRSVARWLSHLLYDDPEPPRLAPARDGVLNRIILLSDGDQMEPGDPAKVAKMLKKKGVIIDCVGIGGSSNEVNENLLKQIASRGPDGRPRYAFIGDKQKLIRKFKELANRIRPA